MTTKTSTKDRAHELHETLTDQVARLTESGEWRRYLDTMRAFRRYSFHNTMLIMVQRPNASLVAGYRKWQDLGRQVCKGEKAIKIFGYSYKYVTDEDPVTHEETKRKFVWFPILNVFDISQTEGDGIVTAADLVGELDGPDQDEIYTRTAAWLTVEGWTVERGNIAPANGYTDPAGRRVIISDTLSDADAAVTVLHEAAHVVLHSEVDDYQQHRGIYEVEAESTAYVIAGLLGLDAAPVSVGYIAGWARGDVDKIRKTAERVHSAVHVIAEALAPAVPAE